MCLVVPLSLACEHYLFVASHTNQYYNAYLGTSSQNYQQLPMANTFATMTLPLVDEVLSCLSLASLMKGFIPSLDYLMASLLQSPKYSDPMRDTVGYKQLDTIYLNKRHNEV